MTAGITPDDEIYFVDHTRMIYGRIRHRYTDRMDLTHVSSWVMRQYDRNEYEEMYVGNESIRQLFASFRI